MQRLLRAGLHFYLIGLIILTLGIALTIQSALGTSPFDALLVGLYRTFGLTIGSWEIVVGTSMLLLNAVAEKKQPEYVAFLTSFLTGVGIDTWLFLIQNHVAPTAWSGQTVVLILGLLFSALGIATYLHSNIAPNPMDRSMLIVSELTGWSVSNARIAINATLVIIAFLFSGPIGIGTLANALFSGMIIAFFLPYIYAMRQKSLPKAERAS